MEWVAGLFQLWSSDVWAPVALLTAYVWSPVKNNYSAIYHPGKRLPLLSPGIKQSPKQINRRPAVVMGAVTEAAARSQPRWLPLQQKSRRWFRPASFVSVHMGPWLKQFKSQRGSGGHPLLWQRHCSLSRFKLFCQNAIMNQWESNMNVTTLVQSCVCVWGRGGISRNEVMSHPTHVWNMFAWNHTAYIHWLSRRLFWHLGNSKDSKG